MQLAARRATLALLTLLAFAVSCGRDSEDPNGNAQCDSEVDSGTSPAPGALTLHGSFFSNESVIIQETDGTSIALGTPDSDRNAFTLTGVPSGHHVYEVVISCDAGRDNLGSFTFDVQ
jgi:hypothetical protein